MCFITHACPLLLENSKMKTLVLERWLHDQEHHNIFEEDPTRVLASAFGGSKIPVQKSPVAVLIMTRAVYRQSASGSGLVTSLGIPPVLFRLLVSEPTMIYLQIKPELRGTCSHQEVTVAGGVVEVTISESQARCFMVLKEPGLISSLVLNHKDMVFGGWAEVAEIKHLYPTVYTLSSP